eukprot:COSAG02_NODE_5833_length_4004_cov_2.279641_1_plen_58_part_10
MLTAGRSLGRAFGRSRVPPCALRSSQFALGSDRYVAVPYPGDRRQRDVEDCGEIPLWY